MGRQAHHDRWNTVDPELVEGPPRLGGQISDFVSRESLRKLNFVGFGGFREMKINLQKKRSA